MILTPMHSPQHRPDYENEVWECWRTRSNAIIHLVGTEVGGSMNMTACGLAVGIGWDHGSEFGNAADWQGCHRCETAYRKWAAKQKKVSAE